MTEAVEVGSAVPSFLIKDHEGFDITNEDLIGSSFVIYFYPKNNTPSCTKEACDFRDHITLLDELDTIVLGVSADNAASHEGFIKKHQLNFTLLCDTNLTMAKSFGVVRKKEGKKHLIRSTFIIDGQGTILWKESPVKVEGHIDRVIQAVKQHCPVDRELQTLIELRKKTRKHLEEGLQKESSTKQKKSK